MKLKNKFQIYFSDVSHVTGIKLAIVREVSFVEWFSFKNLLIVKVRQGKIDYLDGACGVLLLFFSFVKAQHIHIPIIDN